MLHFTEFSVSFLGLSNSEKIEIDKNGHFSSHSNEIAVYKSLPFLGSSVSSPRVVYS